MKWIRKLITCITPFQGLPSSMIIKRKEIQRECIDTVLGKQTQLQQLLQEEFKQEPEKTSEELPGREAGGGRGKEEGEKPQKHVLQPIPT